MLDNSFSHHHHPKRTQKNLYVKINVYFFKLYDIETLLIILQSIFTIEAETVKELLKLSFTGAGFILTLYTLILPMADKFLKPRATEYKKELEKMTEELREIPPTISSEELENLSRKMKTLSKRSQVPSWLGKWFSVPFFGYIISSIISLLYYVISNWIINLFLLSSFIISTVILGIIGLKVITGIYGFLNIEYSKEIDKIKISAHTIIEELREMKEIVTFNFEGDSVGKIPNNWDIEVTMSGKIEVTNEYAADNTSQSLKIHSPENSRDFITTSFTPLQKFTLIYSLRQEVYGDNRGAGIGLMLYLGDTQVIWMAIWRKKLMGWWEGEYHEICNIKLKRWYKIRLDIDCSKSEYYCYIDEKLSRRGQFRNKADNIDTIKTPGWFKQAERVGYLDEIKILRA